MRIVLLGSGVRGIGSYCINLYHVLRAQGHEVLYVSERPWEKEPLESFYQARSFMLFGLAPLVYKPGEVVDAIAEFDPDIIHHHWPSGTMDFFFRRVAALGAPVVVTIHVSIASRNQTLDKFWYLLFSLHRHVFRRAFAVNCISDFVRDQLAQRMSLPDDRIHRIYAGIDENVFTPDAGDPVASEELSPEGDRGRRAIELIFVGQIMPEKGIDILVESVLEVSAERDDLRLTIVGKGPLERKLKPLTEGHSNIRWVGFLTGQKAVASCYASADVTVLPTRWEEAFSLVPIESFGCGTPVIATARGGTPEQVEDGVTGYLLHEGTKEEISARLRALDLDSLRAMRPACRELVLKRHSLAGMGTRHEELYQHVLSPQS